VKIGEDLAVLGAGKASSAAVETGSHLGKIYEKAEDLWLHRRGIEAPPAALRAEMSHWEAEKDKEMYVSLVVCFDEADEEDDEGNSLEDP
jgi:hypothetical protein